MTRRTGRSLKSRVLLGAALWTVGLAGIVHITSVTMAVRFPNANLLAHTALIGFGAALFIVAGFAQVRRGLSPIAELRRRLAEVRDGRIREIDGRYPGEVQPLVDDLNALLAERERAVERAAAKASDLAHGLKTPLAVLMQDADQVAALGHRDLADSLAQQAARMQRQIEAHLTQTRAAAAGVVPGTHCAIAESAEGVARALRRLHADRGVTIVVRTPPSHAVRLSRADLDELLGNLLDNACKWARARVAVASEIAADRRVAIVVDDDGPGLPEAQWETVLQRGVRADEAAPGSGLGLAIVRELAESCGGSIVLGRAPLGGLRATLTLPAATAAAADGVF